MNSEQSPEPVSSKESPKNKVKTEETLYDQQLVILVDGPSPIGKTQKLPCEPLFSSVSYTLIGFPSSNLSGSEYISRWGLTVALNMLVSTVSAIMSAKSPSTKKFKKTPVLFIENSPFAINSFLTTLYFTQKITKMEKKIFDTYYDFLLPIVLPKIDGILILKNSKDFMQISQFTDFPVWIVEPIFYHNLPVFNSHFEIDTLINSKLKISKSSK